MNFYDILLARKLNGDGEGGGSAEPTYTATIVSTGNIREGYNMDIGYSEFGGVKYYTQGQTFAFKEGDQLYFYAKSNDGYAHVAIDGATVAIAESAGGSIDYTYTLPSNDIEIDFGNGTNPAIIRVTFPTIEITSNGIKDVEGYIRADVNVAPNFRTLSVTNNRSSGSATYKKVTFISAQISVADDELRTVDSSVAGGATKDVNILLPQQSTSGNATQYVLMWTASASATPTITSEYCSLIGDVTDGARRISILKIAQEAPDNISITVSQ